MVTPEEEASYYMECAQQLAVWIGQLDVMSDRFEYISNQNNDNADPEIQAHECLEALGKLLGTLICYYMETTKEINKRKEDENGKRNGESSAALCSEIQDKER